MGPAQRAGMRGSRAAMSSSAGMRCRRRCPFVLPARVRASRRRRPCGFRRRGMPVAIHAIVPAHFALASICCIAQKGRAFQASSPKTSSPAGNGRAFFCPVAGSVKAASERAGGNGGAGGRNRTGTGISPTDFHTRYGFRRRHEGVCGLDYPFTLDTRREGRMALGAARLVSTPSPCGAWLGIASEGFPDFEQFYVPGFPGRTQILAFKSGASTSFATPAYRCRL